MRKITKEAYNAFINCAHFKSGNTEVTIDISGVTRLKLHGNTIAMFAEGITSITLAGWNTNTTRERLSPFAKVSTKNGTPLLNGKPCPNLLNSFVTL